MSAKECRKADRAIFLGRLAGWLGCSSARHQNDSVAAPSLICAWTALAPAAWRQNAKGPTEVHE
jgi:hypothetical protein